MQYKNILLSMTLITAAFNVESAPQTVAEFAEEITTSTQSLIEKTAGLESADFFDATAQEKEALVQRSEDLLQEHRNEKDKKDKKAEDTDKTERDKYEKALKELKSKNDADERDHQAALKDLEATKLNARAAALRNFDNAKPKTQSDEDIAKYDALYNEMSKAKTQANISYDSAVKTAKDSKKEKDSTYKKAKTKLEDDEKEREEKHRTTLKTHKSDLEKVEARFLAEVSPALERREQVETAAFSRAQENWLTRCYQARNEKKKAFDQNIEDEKASDIELGLSQEKKKDLWLWGHKFALKTDGTRTTYDNLVFVKDGQIAGCNRSAVDLLPREEKEVFLFSLLQLRKEEKSTTTKDEAATEKMPAEAQYVLQALQKCRLNPQTGNLACLKTKNPTIAQFKDANERYLLTHPAPVVALPVEEKAEEVKEDTKKPATPFYAGWFGSNKNDQPSEIKEKSPEEDTKTNAEKAEEEKTEEETQALVQKLEAKKAE